MLRAGRRNGPVANCRGFSLVQPRPPYGERSEERDGLAGASGWCGGGVKERGAMGEEQAPLPCPLPEGEGAAWMELFLTM